MDFVPLSPDELSTEADRNHHHRREALADCVHKAWTGWMKYRFQRSKQCQRGAHEGTCLVPDTAGPGAVIIPADLVARWERQIATPYVDLPENEKESDRKEADKMLALVEPEIEALEKWCDDLTATIDAISAHSTTVVAGLNDEIKRLREEARTNAIDHEICAEEASRIPALNEEIARQHREIVAVKELVNQCGPEIERAFCAGWSAGVLDEGEGELDWLERWKEGGRPDHPLDLEGAEE